jgi:hypothetical protein
MPPSGQPSVLGADAASGEEESSMRQAHRGDRHRRRRRIGCLLFVAVFAAVMLGATSPSARARHIQITVQAAPPPGANTLERRVSTGSDDAEESATATMSLSSSDLELTNDGNNQKVGIRFNNITIPRGATITRAYVQFEADETQSDATNLTIQAEANDNPLTYTTTANNISSRPAPPAAPAGRPHPGHSSAKSAPTNAPPTSARSSAKSPTDPAGSTATTSP